MKKRKKKKVNNSYKTIVVLVTTIIFLVAMFFIVKDNRNLTFIEKTLKDSVLFINKIATYPFTLFDNSKKLKTIEQNIEKQKDGELDNLKKELEELKKNLSLNNLLSDYDEINATVVSRNLGYWYNTIIIDKGSKDKIKKNMAVITSEGLVGKIIKVTKYNSTVKLLTSDDANNKVSVQIKTHNNYLYGILTTFDKNKGYYTIEGISDIKEIKKGDLVTTTGMGDIFPSGILIGEVIEIGKDNFDLEAIIKIKPSVNIDNFNYVKVLRRKQ